MICTERRQAYCYIGHRHPFLIVPQVCPTGLSSSSDSEFRWNLQYTLTTICPSSISSIITWKFRMSMTAISPHHPGGQTPLRLRHRHDSLVDAPALLSRWSDHSPPAAASPCN
jgi:hypothetical protein